MLFAKFHKANLISYLGAFAGVLSIYFAFSKMAFNEDADMVRYSLACLVIAGICDMFDGKFARSCKRTDLDKEIGIQLDSLFDTFCFLAVPVVFMLSLKMLEIWHVIIYAFFIICGVSRLAYFNVVSSDANKAIKVYQGLPVTSTAITYPLLGLLHTCVSESLFQYLYLGLTLLTAILMIVNIKIPKLKGSAYIIMPILALILVVLLVVL